MALWLIAAPSTEPDALARAKVVRQGFSWPAFWLAPLWLLYHREWLLLALWVAADVLFALVLQPHLPPLAAVATALIAHLWLGLEAARWRGRRLAGLVEVVEAPTREAAELRFFERILLPGSTTGSAPALGEGTPA